MRSILLLGGWGFLGQYVNRALYRLGCYVAHPHRTQLDVLKPNQVQQWLGHDSQWHCVVNCVGFSNVDLSEKLVDEDWRTRVNWEWPKRLAECDGSGAHLIHVASDYSLNPVNNYGRYKARGEAGFYDGWNTNNTLVRVGGLYDNFGGLYGKVERALIAGEVFRAVSDVRPLLLPVWFAAERIASVAANGKVGKFRVDSFGYESAYDFALRVAQAKYPKRAGLIQPITHAEYLRTCTAPRPATYVPADDEQSLGTIDLSADLLPEEPR